MPENLSVFYFDPIHCLGFFRPWLVERGVSVRFRLGAQKRTNRAGLWPVVQAQPGGYSMLEVLVALGLTGIISMGLVKYMQHQSAQVSSLEVQSHSDKLYRYWENLLQEHLNARSTDACEVLGLRPGTDFADVKVSLESLKLDQLGFTAVGFEQGGAQEDEDENPLGDSPEGGVDDGNEDGRTVRLENDPPPPARKPTKQWVPTFGNWRAGLKHADLQLKKEDLELLAGGAGVRSVACLVPVDEEEGLVAACPYPFDESVAPWHSLAWGAKREGESGGSEGEGDEGNIALDAQIYVRDYRVLLDIGVGGGDGTVEKLATAKQVFKFPLVLSTFQKQGGTETLMSCSQHSRVAACMEQGGRLLMQELPEGGVAENFVCDFRAQAFELNAGIELDVENYECPFREDKEGLSRMLCASGLTNIGDIERMKKCGCKVLDVLDPYRHLASDEKEKWEKLSTDLNENCNAPVNEMQGYSVEQCAEVKCEFGTVFKKKQLPGGAGYSGSSDECNERHGLIYKVIEGQKNSIFSNASCDAAKSMCSTERGPYGKGGFYPVKIFSDSTTALYQCVRCRNKKGQYTCPFYTGANKEKPFHENLENAKSVAEGCLSGVLMSGDNNNIFENDYLSSGDFYTLCEQDAAISGMDPEDCHKCLGDAARYNDAVAEVLGAGAFEFETPCSDEADSDCPCYSHPYGCPLGTKDLVKQCNDCKDEKYKNNSWCVERYNQCKILDACNIMKNNPDKPARIRWSFLGKGNNDKQSHFYTYECPLEILEDTNGDGVKEKNEFNFYMRVPAILGAKRLGPSDENMSGLDGKDKKWGVALPELQKKDGRFEVKKDTKEESGFFKKPFNPFPYYTFQERTLKKEEDEEKFKKDFNFLQKLNFNSEAFASYALGCYEEDPKNHKTIEDYNSYANENPKRWKDAKIVGKFKQLLQQEYDLVFNFYSGNNKWEGDSFEEAGSDPVLFSGKYQSNGNEADWNYIKKGLQVKTDVNADKNNRYIVRIKGDESDDESDDERYIISNWDLAKNTSIAPGEDVYKKQVAGVEKKICYKRENRDCNDDETGPCYQYNTGISCVDRFKKEYIKKGEEKIQAYLNDHCPGVEGNGDVEKFVNCRRWFHCDKNKHNRPLYEYSFLKGKDHYTKELLTVGSDGTEKHDSKNPYNRCIYFAKKYGRKFSNKESAYEAENFIETDDDDHYTDKNGNEYKYVKMYFDQDDLKGTYWHGAAKNTVYYLGPRKTKDCIDHSILNLDELKNNPKGGKCKIPEGSP